MLQIHMQTGRISGIMRMEEIKPAHYTTKEEVQEMIDAAIRKHNRNASIISMCVGWVVLALFAEGVLSSTEKECHEKHNPLSFLWRA